MNRNDAEAAVRGLICYAGDDPERAGVLKTPARVAKAYAELFSGYGQNPADVLGTVFDMDDVEGVACYAGIVVLRDIEFYSMCEHHMLPFHGSAHVAYIPGDDGRVVGVSKLARLVDMYARRLQCQERITTQVADALREHLGAKGVAVVLEAQHMCMAMRGIRKTSSTMTTSELRGTFNEDTSARAEVLRLLRGG